MPSPSLPIQERVWLRSQALSRICLDLLNRYAEEFAHFGVEEAPSGAVWLHPSAIDHELGNRALAYIPKYIFSGAGSRFDVDLGVGNFVFIEEALGLAAVAAPRRCVEQNGHGQHHTGLRLRLAARYDESPTSQFSPSHREDNIDRCLHCNWFTVQHEWAVPCSLDGLRCRALQQWRSADDVQVLDGSVFRDDGVHHDSALNVRGLCYRWIDWLDRRKQLSCRNTRRDMDRAFRQRWFYHWRGRRAKRTEQRALSA